jgi:hypothetical protein
MEPFTRPTRQAHGQLAPNMVDAWLPADEFDRVRARFLRSSGAASDMAVCYNRGREARRSSYPCYTKRRRSDHFATNLQLDPDPLPLDGSSPSASLSLTPLRPSAERRWATSLYGVPALPSGVRAWQRWLAKGVQSLSYFPATGWVERRAFRGGSSTARVRALKPHCCYRGELCGQTLNRFCRTSER